MKRSAVIKAFGTFLVTGLLVLAAGRPASALDTDIYLTTNTASSGDAPNVLIVLDTSGSMNTSVVSRPDYDPAIDYSAVSGNPGIPNGRVYWSTSGTPPSTSSSQWISAGNNNCVTSQSYLNSAGVYDGTKFLMWFPHNNNSRAAWKQAASGNDKIMDCLADGTPDASGKYLAAVSAPASQKPYTSSSSNQYNWNSATGSGYTLTLFNSNYMNYYHNSSLTTSTTRMEIAKSAINSLIASTSNVRFGLMVFNRNNADDGTSSGNHGGRVVFRIDNMTPQRITDMTNIVNNAVSSGNTPLAETMWEAYRYFGGKGVDFGDNDPTATPARDTTAESGGTYITPFATSCQQAYVVYVTDGDPTSDTAANGSARIAGLSGIGTINGNALDELAGWMYDHDVPTGAVIDANSTNNRRVITYTIGFGGSISASGLQLLQNTATQGHGKYLDASDANTLVEQLRSTIIDILSVTTSFAAPALSINVYNSLYNRDEVYFAQFKPTATMLWDGNVKKYKQCADTSNATCVFGELIDQNNKQVVDPATLIIRDTVRSYWSSSTDGNNVAKGGAGENVPAPATRSVYTYTGGYNATDLRTPTGTTSLNNAVNHVADSNAALTQAMLNVSSAADRTTLINWIRGVDTEDYDNDTNVTEARWRFADAVHSRPLTVTYGGNSTAPVTKIFVGTNDGALHMINENTGEEEWAFFPQEVLGQLKTLSDDAAGNHPWGMDGGISAYIKDVNKNGIIEASQGDFVRVYVSMRRGGRNVYAVDVTPANVQTSPSSTGNIQPTLLWAIRGGVTPGYEELQQTWSRPLVTTIRYRNTSSSSSHSPKTVLIFGGGYDPVNDGVLSTPQASGNAVYIVDPDTGERLWWASGASSGANLELTNMEYSIPADITAMDANGDGATDRLYVADLAGQIWRIDLSPLLFKNAGNGTSGTRFAALTGSGDQAKRKFYFPPDVAQVNDPQYSANGMYDLVTIATGDREDPLDSLTSLLPNPEPVNNRIYVLRDFLTATLVSGGSLTYPATITDANLYNATANLLQSNPPASELNAIKAASGWFIDLKTSGGSWIGEKSMARTAIFAGMLLVTTYEPPSAAASGSCKALAGNSYLWILNVLNGAAAVDVNADTSKTTADRRQAAGAGLAPEAVISIREAGVSGLVGPVNIKGLPSSLPRWKTFWLQK